MSATFTKAECDLLNDVFRLAMEKCDTAKNFTFNYEVRKAIMDEWKKYDSIRNSFIVIAFHYLTAIDHKAHGIRYDKEDISDFICFLKDNATEISDCILYAIDKANQIKGISQNVAVHAAVDKHMEDLRNLNIKILNL